jgi:hypothetical protein
MFHIVITLGSFYNKVHDYLALMVKLMILQVFELKIDSRRIYDSLDLLTVIEDALTTARVNNISELPTDAASINGLLQSSF